LVGSLAEEKSLDFHFSCPKVFARGVLCGPAAKFFRIFKFAGRDTKADGLNLA